MITFIFNASSVVYRDKAVDDYCNSHMYYLIDTSIVANEGAKCTDPANMKLTPCQVHSYKLAFILIEAYLKYIQDCSWNSFKQSAYNMIVDCGMRAFLHQESLNDCVQSQANLYQQSQEDCMDDLLVVTLDFSEKVSQLVIEAFPLDEVHALIAQESLCPSYVAYSYEVI